MDAEANAIAFGLLASVIIGACLLVAGLIRYARRPDPFDEVGPQIHPADNFPDDWDSWAEWEDWMKRNPDKVAQYERDALPHREGAK